MSDAAERKAFKDSHEAAFRRMVRGAIKKGPFSRAERDITLAIVNHWFHHKGGPKKFIHPSREAIAKKSGTCVRSVASAFAMLRDCDILRPVSGMNGGRHKATHYTVDVWKLMVFCGVTWVEEFLSGAGQNCTVSSPDFARFSATGNRAAIAHCLNDVGDRVVSFRRGGISRV